MDATFTWGGDLDPDDFIAAIEDFTNALAGRLEAAVEDIALKIRGEAQEEAPVDTGRLRASLEEVVENVGGEVFRARVGSNLEYAAPMEFGTSPFFPPPSDLRRWAGRVLGDESMAFPVARAIAASGIEEQPYLGPAFEGIATWAVDRITAAVDGALTAAGLR